MTPTVFGYIMLFTLLLAGAAAAVEWGAQGRVATRHLWTVAIVFAMLAPPAVLVWHAMAHHAPTTDWSVTPDASTQTLATRTPSHESLRDVTSLGIGVASIRAIVPGHTEARVVLARLGARFTGIAITVWATVSLALLLWLAAGVSYWRRVRKSWEHTTVDGVHVDVSPVTGPAVLGLISQRIVLPAWATTMQLKHRRLVLAHESEHISAHDPQRLALATAALIVMPWNIALWWCASRLRRAIELDCDARVLRRFPNTKEYGYVLLEVAARAGPRARLPCRW